MCSPGYGFAPFSVARRSAALSDPTPRIGPRRYSRPAILEAIRAWGALCGEPPTVVDWEPSRARRVGHAWRADPFESGTWPTTRMVRAYFKHFNAAVEEAGLPPRRGPSRVAARLAGSEAILAALVEWTRRYGDVPTMADWDPHRARSLGQKWRIARYHQGDWPSARDGSQPFRIVHQCGCRSRASTTRSRKTRRSLRSTSRKSSDDRATRREVTPTRSEGPCGQSSNARRGPADARPGLAARGVDRCRGCRLGLGGHPWV